jgi:serine/threonine protein kinase
VTYLSDAVVGRLRRVGNWPELASSRYVVLDELGRGGMGTVYLARDQELERDVALKISNAIASPEFEQRLQREARTLARLEHPGIVPVHDVGRLADGRLFYVMKRLAGKTLQQRLPSLDAADRLGTFERICEPVGFAHARGVIHRDLKPANIMLGGFGEVIVLDWGLAKATVDPGGSAMAGTHGYMAPEQASPGSCEIDHRADVYALGAILHLLLTDTLPAGDDAESGLRRARVPRPLAAICATALRRSPGARYQSVAAMQDDVARYRGGRAVSVYRETPWERIVRFTRTYRTPILLVLAYLVMRTLVAVFAGW